MATVAPTQPTALPDEAASPPPSVPIGGDQRTVFRGVGRHVYDALSEAQSEPQHLRLAYDGTDLEIIMVVSYVHEHRKELLSKIVNAVTSGLDIDYLSCGETTWNTEQRGLQADLSYYFDPEKIRQAKAAQTRDSRDPADYPKPDLAIEIDTSPPQIDRPGIYADLRVAEVWRFVKGGKLIMEQLQEDGTYAPVAVSRFLRIGPKDVLRWLNDAASERESAWNRRLNQWAMGLGQPG
jgi:Uma2 family endonuclease